MPRTKMFSEESISLSIRMPVTMKEAIEKRAIKERRSVNQEVVRLLQIALESLEEKEQNPKEGS